MSHEKHEETLPVGQDGQGLETVLNNIVIAARNVQKEITLFNILRKGDLSEEELTMNFHILFRVLDREVSLLHDGLSSLSNLQLQSPELIRPEDLAKLLAVDLKLLSLASEA